MINSSCSPLGTLVALLIACCFWSPAQGEYTVMELFLIMQFTSYSYDSLTDI